MPIGESDAGFFRKMPPSKRHASVGLGRALDLADDVVFVHRIRRLLEFLIRLTCCVILPQRNSQREHGAELRKRNAEDSQGGVTLMLLDTALGRRDNPLA
jgi:hypothetical protein